MDSRNEFAGVNAGYVLELYDRYRQNPEAVDAETRAFFRNWTPPDGWEHDGAERNGKQPAQAEHALPLDKIVGAVNLANSIRSYGHLAATHVPLREQPRGDPSLAPKVHGLTEADLREMPAHLIGGPTSEHAANALEAVQALRRIYSGNMGYSYEHIHEPEEREWLRDAAEARRFTPNTENLDAVALLQRLTRVEVFEQFLHRSFPGKTRFSIEGLDMLVPILDEIIDAAMQSGIRNLFMGMAHRGRLNVLANVLDKPIRQILAEFRDPTSARDLTMREELGWTGDVKYHAGARSSQDGDAQEVDLSIIIPPNPSHLEAIDPVVEGMARAEGTRVDTAVPQFDPKVSLPLLIHGDAAFPGEGVVAETLNLSRLPGYQTGGTIHIIANNQLGYTTSPKDGRSTLYASDLAKGFEIPIVHVNADDPEAGIEAARLAAAYRAKFQKDFLINLVGYRRYGHNEGDEPVFTQPRMYERIAKHPTVRALWAKTLSERGLIDATQADGFVQAQMSELQQVLDSLHPEDDLVEPAPASPPRGAAQRVETAVPLDQLRALNETLLRMPESFALNPKLERTLARRRKALEDPDARTVDWATAEQLAFASILEQGTAIRLTGQDVERGTFGHRHAVLHDVKTGDTFTPLQAVAPTQAAFEVHDSPLTEMATIGFEYGYNTQKPERFVLWEAQYGDFINVAQPMIDEFLLSARAKWGQTPSLVLLLPHAWEGQGPDHSSGRLERFLSLAAETNMRVTYPTTAAQYFHLLRRQALLLKTDPLPLIVMTPKSLLRHAQSASMPRELAEGNWEPVLDDAEAHKNPDAVQRLILVSGKMYVDLVEALRGKDDAANPKTAQGDEGAAKVNGTNVETLRRNVSTGERIAIVRLEQLYRFPAEPLANVIAGYKNLQEVVWVQEEPENMGAWEFVQPHLLDVLKGRVPLRHLSRPRNSSPAEGSNAWHNVNQKKLVQEALG